MDKKTFLNTIYNSAVENNKTKLYTINDFDIKAKEILNDLCAIEKEIKKDKASCKSKYEECNNNLLALMNKTNHLINEKKYIKILKTITKQKNKINRHLKNEN